MQTTWTNNRVALAKDLLFGLCIYTENNMHEFEWVPVDSLSLEDVETVHQLVDYNPSCIYQDDLNAILEAKKQEKANDNRNNG